MMYWLKLVFFFLLCLPLCACTCTPPNPGIDSDEGYFSGTLLSLTPEQAVVQLDTTDSTIEPTLIQSYSEIQFFPHLDGEFSPLTPKVGDRISGSYPMSHPIKQITDTRVEIDIYNWELDDQRLTGTVLRIEDNWVVLTPAESDPLRKKTDEVWLSRTELLSAKSGNEVRLSLGDQVEVFYVRELSTFFPPQVTVKDCEPESAARRVEPVAFFAPRTGAYQRGRR